MNIDVLYEVLGTVYPQNKEKQEELFLIIEKLETEENLSKEEKEDIEKLIQTAITELTKKVNRIGFDFKYTEKEKNYFKAQIYYLKKIREQLA